MVAQLVVGLRVGMGVGIGMGVGLVVIVIVVVIVSHASMIAKFFNVAIVVS